MQGEKCSQIVVAAAALAVEKLETPFVLRLFHRLSRFFVSSIRSRYR
jgi:hypothetical protein